MVTVETGVIMVHESLQWTRRACTVLQLRAVAACLSRRLATPVSAPLLCFARLFVLFHTRDDAVGFASFMRIASSTTATPLVDTRAN